MFLRFATLATAITFALPAVAQDNDSDVLFELLMLPDIIDIMREEGVSYSDTIGQDLFAGNQRRNGPLLLARFMTLTS